MPDRMRQVALGAAILAVAIVSMTALVLVNRTAPPGELVQPLERRVTATDVVKLRSSRIEAATGGIRITDRSIAGALGLDPADVIVSLSGRPLRREFDLIDALLAISMMSPTSLYVELDHARARELRVWRIDGDLRVARAAALEPRLSGPVTAVADPLVATIIAIDSTHVEMPGPTADQIIADPSTYVKSVRTLPWTSYGVTTGVKLFAIRPGTVLDAMGIKNGDIVRGLDGVAVTSIDDLVDQLVRSRRTNVWTIDLERRNKAMILTIAIQ